MTNSFLSEEVDIRGTFCSTTSSWFRQHSTLLLDEVDEQLLSLSKYILPVGATLAMNSGAIDTAIRLWVDAYWEFRKRPKPKLEVDILLGEINSGKFGPGPLGEAGLGREGDQALQAEKRRNSQISLERFKQILWDVATRGPQIHTGAIRTTSDHSYTRCSLVGIPDLTRIFNLILSSGRGA